MFFSIRILKRSYSDIGVDFGSDQIKIIQFRKRRNKILLHRLALLKLPDESINEGKIIPVGAILRKIKEALKKHRFKGKTANISINNHKLRIRSLKLPQMNEKEILEAVRWESESCLAMPVDNSVTDYIYSREINAEGKELIKAHIVVVPKEIVKSYLDITEKSGLYPATVEIESFSFARLLRFMQKKDDRKDNEINVIYDIGGKVSSINIFENGEFAWFRSIDIGINRIIKKVVSNENITEKEALEKLKKENIITHPFYKEIADDLAEKLSQNLDNYLFRIRDKEGKPHCRELLLTGGGALIRDLPLIFNQKLFTRIICLNPFDDGIIGVTDKMSREEKIIFNVAAGLALRGWAFSEK